MNKKTTHQQKSPLSTIIILLLFAGLVYLTVIGFKGLTQAAAGQTEFAPLASKYQVALNRVDNLIRTFPKDIFENPVLKQLVHYFPLPLTVTPGKDNPFALPAPPEQLLLSR